MISDDMAYDGTRFLEWGIKLDEQRKNKSVA